MQVRDLKNLLNRFHLDDEIEGHDLTILRVVGTRRLVLVPEREKEGLLKLAPHYYEDPLK